MRRGGKLPIAPVVLEWSPADPPGRTRYDPGFARFDALPPRLRMFVKDISDSYSADNICDLYDVCVAYLIGRGHIHVLSDAVDMAIQSIRADLAKRKAERDAMAVREDGTWGSGRSVCR